MKQKKSLLIALPHSSNILPPKVWDNVNLSKQEVEFYLDIGSAQLYNLDPFHILPAKYSRLYCDLNRAPDHQTTTKNRQGMVLKTTYQGKKIYKKPLMEEEKKRRINEHNKYFKSLKKYTKENNIDFLIAGHTMHHLLGVRRLESKKRPDICLSNNYFVTCSAQNIHELRQILQEEGYTVSINDPFRGAYLLNHLCHRDALPGIQMEFSFNLIGDPKTQKLNLRKVASHKLKLQNAFLKFLEAIE